MYIYKRIQLCMIKLKPFVPPFPPTPVVIVLKNVKVKKPIVESKVLTIVSSKSQEKDLFLLEEENSWVYVEPEKNLVELISESKNEGYKNTKIIDFLKKLEEDFKEIVTEYYRVKRLWESKMSSHITSEPAAPRPTYTSYHYTPPSPRPKEYYQYTPPPSKPEEKKKKEVQFFKENVDPKIVNKVRALLRLSESNQKGEAELAMVKAREISHKYGIILESIEKW